MQSVSDEREQRGTWWLVPRDQAMDRLGPWPLARQLLSERRFRYAFAACSAVILAAALGIPRIWIVSPPGFYPTIRISWLDVIEARLYRRLALGAELDGNRQQAWNYWRQACSHNPTSRELIRHSLSNALTLPVRNLAYFSDAMSRTAVLMAVSRTNAQDLGLTLTVLGHFRLYDLIPDLAQNAPELAPAVETLVCKAFLWLSRPDAYAKARQRWEHVSHDPEIPLYDAALDAGWSTDALAAAQGLERLEQYAKGENSSLGVLALQLRLLVTAQKRDTSGYERSLVAIQDRHEDEPLQHAQFWQMLETDGRKARAIELARRAQMIPMSSTEILGVTDALIRLGLSDDAIDFLERFASPVKANADVWLRYAEMLIDRQRWEDVRKVAVDIRSFPHLQFDLYGYSHFIEGLALRARGDFDAAEANFQLVPRLTFRKPELALRVAKRLAEVREFRPAVEVALAHEEHLELRTDYWNFLVEVASSLKDSALMLRAAQRAYALNRKDLNLMNNFAAALIVTRSDPERLLALTTALYQWNPNILAAKVNHSLALVENNQVAEADAILSRITQTNLSSLERTMVSMAKAEVAGLKSDWPAAYSNLGLIDYSYLFPEQSNRLENLRSAALIHLPSAASDQHP
jgi:hypothetical protein